MLRKPLKILLMLLATLFLLLLSAVIALPFFIDPNDFKPVVVAWVKEKTGRELEIPGDIELSVFPWLGFTTGKVVLKNSQEFQYRPFITIEQSDIKVKLLPLLFAKNIQVSRIILQGLNLNLIKNKQGIGNWDDLMVLERDKKETAAEGKTTKTTDVEMPAEPFVAFAIGGIAVEQAHINWDNQETGKHIELKEFNLTADRFTFGQPAAINLAFKLDKAAAKVFDAARLSSTLKVEETFNQFQLTNLDLELFRNEATPQGNSLTAALTAVDIAFDRSKQTIKMTGVELNSGDLAIKAEISGDHMNDKPVIRGPFTVASFNPSNMMKQLNLSVPAMRDTKALSTLAINFDLSATEESVAIENIAAQLDDTRIKGTASVSDFTQPAINFDLNLDAIDADRYLSPKTKTDKSIASPAVALAVGLSKLPADTLRKLNANGDVTLSKLKISGLTMQGVHFSLNGKNGKVAASQSIKQFYQGSYVGDLTMDLRNDQPALLVIEKIERVRIEPLLKDYKGKARLNGVVNASTRLQGQGLDSKALKSNLNGQVDFLLKDGSIKGFNLQKIIDRGKALAKGEAPVISNENEQTVFSEITGSAKLNGGVLQNNDLLAKSSKFRVEGNGSANLNNESLNYKLIAKQIKKQAIPSDPEQFHSTPVIIKVGGTFDQPTYTLDVAALLTDKNKAKIEKLLDKKKEKIDKLMDKLDKKLGPGASDLLKNIF